MACGLRTCQVCKIKRLIYFTPFQKKLKALAPGNQFSHFQRNCVFDPVSLLPSLTITIFLEGMQIIYCPSMPRA